MILEIPLDLGFCDVNTEHRSEQRMRTGAVRRGLRFVGVQPTSFTTHSGIGAGQCSPAISDRVLGETQVFLGTTGSRRPEQATAKASGQTGSTGNRRQRRPAGACPGDPSGSHGGVPARQPGPRETQVAWGQRGNGSEPKDLGPPQLASVRTVPIGTRTDGTGNRVSVKR